MEQTRTRIRGNSQLGMWVATGVIALLLPALALAVNLGAVIMLLPMRNGDANLRSVWLCSRNDAFGNILVIFAAAATAATRSPWPDFAVGAIMCLLFVSGSWAVYSQARRESAAAIVG